MSTPMTKEGYEALRAELNRLRELRPEISDAIAAARALGDLKENSAYPAARERQGMTEARIRDLEVKLSGARVIDVSTLPRNNKVLFGIWVDAVNLTDGKTARLRIVGGEEADPGKGCISVDSPVAKALLGKEVGEQTQVETADGLVTYEIAAVHYDD